jgi:hypothetical protein
MEDLHATTGRHIQRHAARLAGAITDRQYARQPDLLDRYGERGREKCRQDAAHHLRSLASAIKVDSPPLLREYLVWLAQLLRAYRIPLADLQVQWTCVGEVVEADLPTEAAAIVARYIQIGADHLAELEAAPAPADPPVA